MSARAGLRWWVALALAAFVVRVACFSYLHAKGQFRLGEGRLMLGAARSVADGRGLQLPGDLLEPGPSDRPVARRTLREWREAGGFWGVVRPGEPTAYLSPVYPVVLAGLMRVAGEQYLSAIVVFQAVLGVLTCLLIVGLGRLFLRESVARSAGWVAAFYPVLVYQACDIWDHCLFTLLLIVWVFTFLKACRTGGWARWVTVGLLAGVVFLVRPVGLPILALMLVWMWVRRLGTRAGATVVLLLAFAAAVSPWVFRNWKVMGEPLLLPTKGGRNLWEFNNARLSDYFLWSEPPSTLRRYLPLREKYLPTLKRKDLVEFPAFAREDELERDAILQKRVHTFLLANPALYAELCLLRVGDFFRVVPIHARSALQRTAVAVPSGLVLLMCIIGAVVTISKGPSEGRFLVCLLVLYAGGHVLTAAGLTYRVPVEPYMLLLAAHGAAFLFTRSSPGP